jgi:hypothetical protein
MYNHFWHQIGSRPAFFFFGWGLSLLSWSLLLPLSDYIRY